MSFSALVLLTAAWVPGVVVGDQFCFGQRELVQEGSNAVIADGAGDDALGGVNGDACLFERGEVVEVLGESAAETIQAGDGDVGDLALGSCVEQLRERWTGMAVVAEGAGCAQPALAEVRPATGFLPVRLLPVRGRAAEVCQRRVKTDPVPTVEF